MQRHIMSYSDTLRSELKSDGYLVEELIEEERFQIRASKNAEVFVGEADTLAVAFLDLTLDMRKRNKRPRRYRQTPVKHESQAHE